MILFNHLKEKKQRENTNVTRPQVVISGESFQKADININTTEKTTNYNNLTMNTN